MSTKNRQTTKTASAQIPPPPVIPVIQETEAVIPETTGTPEETLEPTIEETNNTAETITPTSETTSITESTEVLDPKVIAEEPVLADSNSIDGVLDLMLASEDKATKFFAAALRKYITTMSGNAPIDRVAGYSVQATFITNLLTFLETVSFESFNRSWNLFLAIVRMSRQEKAGCFTDRYVMRFLEQYRGNKDRLVAYQNIMNVALHTCEPETRNKAIRTEMSFNKLMSVNGITDTVSGKLTSFYMQ